MEEAIIETGALMLVLENTHTRAGGTVLTPELTADLAAAAQRHGAYVHLDGARLFNAAVALGVPVAELAAPVNTVAVSLNKGLCAPMGTILAGRTQVIELAHDDAAPARRGERAQGGHRGRGGARRTRHARRPARRRPPAGARARGAAAGDSGIEVEPAEIETNIVLVDVSGTELDPDEFVELLAERGVLALERDTSRVRFVTHRLIGDAEISGPRRSSRRSPPSTLQTAWAHPQRQASGAGKYDLQARIGVRDESGTSLTPLVPYGRVSSRAG